VRTRSDPGRLVDGSPRGELKAWDALPEHP
jgi:hypothetical protein